MALTTDNELDIQVSGQADWDTALDANFTILERGLHTVARAAYDIHTGDLLWMTSGGFWQRFDPASAGTEPQAVAFTFASSGESFQAILRGIFRGGVDGAGSAFLGGVPYYASAASPGLIVRSFATQAWHAGYGLDGGGIYFNPSQIAGIDLTSSLDALRVAVGSVDAFLVSTFTAGAAIIAGRVFWQNSGANAFHFDPNSLDSRPHGLALTGATGAGSLFQGLMQGLVTALMPTSPGGTLIPGFALYVSVMTPGLAVHSYSAANRRVGRALSTTVVNFDPEPFYATDVLSRGVTVTINPTSEHLFSFDVGKQGVVRDLLMKSNSADKVGLAFFSNSARNNLMYQTISGGVTTVSSFTDRALWPYENTDASTLSGILYGKVFADSGAAVASQDVVIQMIVDRSR